MAVRLFLVGTPRSGTTLLQCLLGLHPDLRSYTESHLFSKMRILPGEVRIAKTLPPRFMAFIEENKIETDLDPPEPGVHPLEFGLAQARKCISLLDVGASQRVKAGWLEKTPLNLLHLDSIRTLAPDAKIIHIVRHPASVVRSLQAVERAWHKGGTSAIAPEMRWARDAMITLERAEHDYVVVYEQLAENPVAILDHLFQAIGLRSWQVDPDRHSEVAAQVVLPYEREWKANNLRPGVNGSQTNVRLASVADSLVRLYELIADRSSFEAKPG